MYIYIIIGPPTPVNSLMESQKCSRYFTVSWSPPSSDPVCGPVSYDVLISSTDGVVMLRTTNTFYNFTGLRPGTSYTVTMVGINIAGVGKSNMITVSTLNVNEAVTSGEYII